MTLSRPQPFLKARTILIGSALFLSFVSITTAAAVADEVKSITDIVAKLKRQEARYANLDVKWIQRYRKLYEGERPGMALSSRATMHSVTQAGSFRIVEKKRVVDAEGRPRDASFVCVFDGSKTQRLKQNRPAQVSKGKRADWRLFRPHTLPLRQVRERVPLSVYIGGTEALAKHPDGQIHGAGIFIDSSYVGDEMVGKDLCHKVLLKRGQIREEMKHQTSRIVFWLATRRNLLPIKTEGYLVHVSQTLPLNVGRMGDLREVEPGVWLPFEYKATGYDTIDLEERGNYRLLYREDYKVVTATLKPNYPHKFFSNIEMPANAVDLKMGADGAKTQVAQ